MRAHQAGARRFVRNVIGREGPRWPVALELARMGTPIGVCLLPQCGSPLWVAVCVDGDGVLVALRRLSPEFLVRWCINRNLRIFHHLGELAHSLQAGRCVGWVQGMMVEVKGGRSVPFLAEPLTFVVGAQADEPGAVRLDPLLSEPGELVFS